jgi:hypothetical protein
MVRIHVVDRASTPLADVSAWIVGAGDSVNLSGADGICRVRAKQLPVDVDISAFGYLRQRLMGVDADREVVLEDGYPIRLRAGVASHGSSPKYLLGVMMFFSGDQGALRGPTWLLEIPWDKERFDDHGELELRMPAAGTYECRLQVTVLRDDGVGSGAIVQLASMPRITVLPSAEEQVFELAIPQSAVDEAVERALH